MRSSFRGSLTVGIALCAVALGGELAAACPFCAAVSPSLSDRLRVARVAIVAKVVPDSLAAAQQDTRIREVELTPVRFLKGGEEIVAGAKILAPIPVDPDAQAAYFVMGAPEADVAGGAGLVWSLPLPVSESAADFIATLDRAPAERPKRLEYFIPHLHDPDPLIARDAYDEFGAAPYADVKAVAASLPREQLLGWATDEAISADRRRLFFTLLGVCGKPEDADALWLQIEASLAAPEPDRTLDAAIACFLTLKGADGLPRVDDALLGNKESQLGDIQSTVLALRFHGEEETIIPRERLLASLRLMLDRPEAADLVIPDLARWGDWSVVDRLSTMFREAAAEHEFLRVPIVKYLQACPDPAAKQRVAELARDFPEIVARASVMPLELGTRRNKRPPRKTSGDQDQTSGGVSNAGPRGPAGAIGEVSPTPGNAEQPDAPLVAPAAQNSAGAASSPAGGELSPGANAPSETSASTASTANSIAESPLPPRAKPQGFFTNLTVGLLMSAAACAALVTIGVLLRDA